MSSLKYKQIFTNFGVSFCNILTLSDFYCFSKTFLHNWRPREEKNGESSQKTEKRQEAAAHPFSAALCLLCEKSASLSSVAAEADLLRLGKIVASLPVNREEARISTLKLLQLNSICHFIIVTVSESDSDTKSWTKVRGLREDYCNKR